MTHAGPFINFVTVTETEQHVEADYYNYDVGEGAPRVLL